MTALATRTQRPAVHLSQQAALASAQRLHYGTQGRHRALSWGQGPLVLLVHGWNGRAAQLAPLAAHLASEGWHCVAPDVTGHGDSAGRRTAWRFFMHDLAALVKTLQQPVHAVVGHSAGGLAAAAARALHGVQATRWVGICAPSHPFPPIRALRDRLAPPEAVLDRYRQHLAHQFGTSWAPLQAGRAWAGLGADLLLCYDHADRFVDASEGARIQAWCPGSTLVTSHGHGHARVLVAAQLHAAVAAFVAGRAPVPWPVQPPAAA